jgi:hypothetical protein
MAGAFKLRALLGDEEVVGAAVVEVEEIELLELVTVLATVPVADTLDAVV